MPQLRKDPILNRWVIISSERINRPSDFRSSRESSPKGGFCPFCEGNEYTTPPEILSFRSPESPPDSPGWSLRVVPNKFPALTDAGEADPGGQGLFRFMKGVGNHEVIIETPLHDLSLATMSHDGVVDVLRAYRSRLLDLRQDQRLKYVLIFKNHGPSAGATLEHSHSQLIGLPIVPSHIRGELSGSLSHYRQKGRCIFCDMAAAELSSGERIVAETEHFVALAPYASPFPFETWILPKAHTSSFHASPGSYQDLAALLGDLLGRIGRLLDDPDYNFTLHTSPLGEDDLPHYHWHIELRPTLNRVAGFEWGSGFHINPTPPEKAASFLRDAR
jgi:UDPglucose--hexose-1-phosphate uridylyltransferase